MLLRTKRFGNVLNTHDLWKAAAIILMVIDHMGAFFFTEDNWIRVVGRLCVPIWFFFVGYSTSQKLDLFVIAGAVVVVAVSAALKVPLFPMNILVTILVYRIVNRLWIIPYLERGVDTIRLSFLMILILLWHPIAMIGWQYGTVALPFAVFGTLARMGVKDNRTIMWEIAALFLFVLLQSMSFHFSGLQQLVLSLGLCGVMALLYKYQLRPITLPCLFSYPVMLIARQSLLIYVVHWLIFIAIHRQMHPLQYEVFKLVKW